MNGRQKAGVGMLVSGVISVLIGVLVTQTAATPAWVNTAIDVAGFIFPAIGLMVNLPANTDPR